MKDCAPNNLKTAEHEGIIFCIEEFAVFDGPGIRTCVFFKGCPLRCNWCHNPEGLRLVQEIVRNPNGCIMCNKCREACKNEKCTLCGECIAACPKNLIRFSGTKYTASELTAKLLKNADMLKMGGGGITFSGGECTMQGEFLFDVLCKLSGKVHVAVETCGHCESEIFARIISKLDLVIFDLKLVDSSESKKYTGVGNEKILANLDILKKSNVPFIIRVPLIPAVTDTDSNLEAIAKMAGGAKYVELLPYNKLAGSKYAMMGIKYKPLFDDKVQCNINTSVFERNNVKVRVQ